MPADPASPDATPYDPVTHLLDLGSDALDAQRAALHVAVRALVGETAARHRMAGVIRDFLFFAFMSVVEYEAEEAPALDETVDSTPAMDWIKDVLVGVAQRLSDTEDMDGMLDDARVRPMQVAIQVVQRDGASSPEYPASVPASGGAPLPMPTAVYAHAECGASTLEEERGITVNPAYAGVYPAVPALVPDETWVRTNASLIRREGPEQYLVNLLSVLRAMHADMMGSPPLRKKKGTGK